MKREVKELIQSLSQQEGRREVLEKIVKEEVKRVFRELLEEIALVEREAHCQNNKDVGNGFYLRSLQSLVGKLDNLRIPRTRRLPFRPFFIKPYRRVCWELEELVIAMYQGGCSTRDISRTIGALLEGKYSPFWVSRISPVVHQKVEAFRKYFRRGGAEDKAGHGGG